MNKTDVDRVVHDLLERTKETRWTKEEIYKKFEKNYSKDQIERIYHRYMYLSDKKGNSGK